MIIDKGGSSSAKPEAWLELGFVENYHCLKQVEKCLRKNFPCLGKAHCLKKDRHHLVRTWQYKKNLKYLKAHHNAHFSTFVGLGGGSGSMPGK